MKNFKPDPRTVITSVEIRQNGLFIQFEDGKNGIIPFEELKLGFPIDIEYCVLNESGNILKIVLLNGNTEEYPWDFLRPYCDEEYVFSGLSRCSNCGYVYKDKVRQIKLCPKCSGFPTYEKPNIAYIRGAIKNDNSEITLQ
ncbi:MAG: hypothetical protein AABY22_36015 [Nanoarchaeota archaeon]